MKSRIISLTQLFLLVGSFSLLSAQQSFKQELALGVNGGATFSKVSFSPKVNQSYLMGMTGGLSMRWITQKHLGLLVELNYSQQGWEEDYSMMEVEQLPEYKRMLNYIELPFFSHFYAGNGKLRYFLNVGPKFGYLFSKSETMNAESIPSNFYTAQHGLPIKYAFDWGLAGGPGIELHTKAGSFILEGRFYYALGDLFGNKKKDAFFKSSQQVLTAKITYLFNLKR